MKIQVTEDHIRKGVPDNWECCAVALALREHVKLWVCVQVESHLIFLAGDEFRTPSDVSAFIEAFDKLTRCDACGGEGVVWVNEDGYEDTCEECEGEGAVCLKKVDPFEFELEIPDGYLR